MNAIFRNIILFKFIKRLIDVDITERGTEHVLLDINIIIILSRAN